MTEPRTPLPRLDHVVIAVHDLDRAMARARSLGLQVQPGGRHPGRLSHNALVAFDDGSYLELIAWRGANDEPWFRTLSDAGEGYVDHALLPQDIDASVAAAHAQGLSTLSAVTDGHRQRPDGQQVAWRSARQSTRALPFLCRDLTPRVLRVPDGAACRHPLGATGVAAVVTLVPDLTTACAQWQALLGQPLLPGPGSPAQTLPWLNAGGLACAHVAIDGATLVLVSPVGAKQADIPATALRERLTHRGAGPCAVVLRMQAAIPPCPEPAPWALCGALLWPQAGAT